MNYRLAVGPIKRSTRRQGARVSTCYPQRTTRSIEVASHSDTIQAQEGPGRIPTPVWGDWLSGVDSGSHRSQQLVSDAVGVTYFQRQATARVAPASTDFRRIHIGVELPPRLQTGDATVGATLPSSGDGSLPSASHPPRAMCDQLPLRRASCRRPAPGSFRWTSCSPRHTALLDTQIDSELPPTHHTGCRHVGFIPCGRRTLCSSDVDLHWTASPRAHLGFTSTPSLPGWQLTAWAASPPIAYRGHTRR